MAGYFTSWSPFCFPPDCHRKTFQTASSACCGSQSGHQPKKTSDWTSELHLYMRKRFNSVSPQRQKNRTQWVKKSSPLSSWLCSSLHVSNDLRFIFTSLLTNNMEQWAVTSLSHECKKCILYLKNNGKRYIRCDRCDVWQRYFRVFQAL